MIELLTDTGESLAITLYLTVGHLYHHCQIWFLLSLTQRSINQIVLIKACEINLLHVSHVENVLQEGKVAEHVLVRHLYRERSLSSNALHWKESNQLGGEMRLIVSPVFIISTFPMSSNFLMAISSVQKVPVRPIPALQWTTMGGPRSWPVQAGTISATISVCFSRTHWNTGGHTTVSWLPGLAHLEELQHAQGAVRRAVVRPGGELEVTDVSLLPRRAVGDLQVRHDEVLVVLDIFRLNAVLPTLYAGACDRERFIKQQLELIRPHLPALASTDHTWYGVSQWSWWSSLSPPPSAPTPSARCLRMSGAADPAWIWMRSSAYSRPHSWHWCSRTPGRCHPLPGRLECGRSTGRLCSGSEKHIISSALSTIPIHKSTSPSLNFLSFSHDQRFRLEVEI